MSRMFALGLVATLSATPLAAQEAAEVCRAMSEVAVGDWVEYETRGATGPGAMAMGPTRITQAVVDTEQVDGERHFWFENKMVTTMGDVIVQMLVPGWPFNTGQVQRMVMQMGDQPAMAVSAQVMDMMRSQMPENPSIDAAHGCGDGEVLGWESISVPAGTYRALHIRPRLPDRAQVTSEIWVSPDVPFGIVKVTLGGADGGEIVLVGHGTDATSSIGERQRQ